MKHEKSLNINNTKKSFSWEFTDKNNGSFIVENADFLPSLYFPLMNSFGMKTYVTPELKGDICSSFHNYLTAATVTEELHRNVSSRNFWIYDHENTPWSATGVSAAQKAEKWTNQSDTYSLEAQPGSFTSKIVRQKAGLSVSITTFVPELEHFVEIMKITIENISETNKNVTPTYCIPVFARSADNFRDHRQVTTMFQKNFIEEHGVRIKPNIVHDEKGHVPNKTNYIVLGFDENGNTPSEKWILAQDFIGDGGSFDNPEAVFRNRPAPVYQAEKIHGKEAVGAFRFQKFTLKPGEKREFIILHGITDNEADLELWKNIFGTKKRINEILDKTNNYWQQKTSSVVIKTGNPTFDNWVKWVSFQVICRQIFGNSYLPDFGYGRGGRGWRDLWQDLLSIFLVDPASAKSEMLNNFMGIRIDGTNATIIGTNSGEFKADRNDIPRTWCDHGAWPAFILNFYLNQTGDYDIIFKQISYWKDKHIYRNKKQDKYHKATDGNKLLTEEKQIYTGSLFEHVLIQQLSAFYNVGNHNILLLEGGDWNDTYDMARENGESVCFHNFYSQNLSFLVEILNHIKEKGVNEIELLSEITFLLDRLPGQEKVNYNSPENKRNRLEKYFETVSNKVSGEKILIPIDNLIIDLKEKAEHNANHIRNNEIIETKSGLKFFNGHYDNLGKPVGGEKDGQISMDLTSQVMPVLCNISNYQQTKDSFAAIQ